jgi:hypothetical protein
LYTAKHLISHHVVKGFPDQRLAYLSDTIQATSAQYCAVLKPGAFTLLGVVKFSDIVAIPNLGTRIFSDLMRPPPLCVVRDSDPVEKVLDLLCSNPSEVAVSRESGGFFGLITPESFFRWLLAKAPPEGLGLEKFPQDSPWSPYANDSKKRKEASIFPLNFLRPAASDAMTLPYPQDGS